MKLTGKVVTIESGDSYTDKLERIVIRFEQADSCYRDVRIANTDEYQLNDLVQVNLSLLPKVARVAS